jgi:hypothetical protein
MSTDAVTPLRQRMIEDMNARKLCAGTQIFTAAGGLLRFSSGPRIRPQRRTSVGSNCIFPRRACGFLRLRTGIPIDCGQSFQSIADSIPMIADSSPIDGF